MRRPLPKILLRLAGSTRGATAIEYGLIVALVTLAVIGAMRNVATGSSSLWGSVHNQASNAM